MEAGGGGHESTPPYKRVLESQPHTADVTCALQTLPLTTLFHIVVKKKRPLGNILCCVPSRPTPPSHHPHSTLLRRLRLETFWRTRRITRFALEIRDSSTMHPSFLSQRGHTKKKKKKQQKKRVDQEGRARVNGKTKRKWGGKKVFSNPHADLFLYVEVKWI